MALGTPGTSFEEILLNQLGNLGSVKKESTITAPPEKFDIGSLLTGLMFLLGNKDFMSMISGLFSNGEITDIAGSAGSYTGPILGETAGGIGDAGSSFPGGW